MNPDRAQEQADIGDEMAERYEQARIMRERVQQPRRPREETEWSDQQLSVGRAFLASITGMVPQ